MSFTISLILSFIYKNPGLHMVGEKISLVPKTIYTRVIIHIDKDVKATP